MSVCRRALGRRQTLAKPNAAGLLRRAPEGARPVSRIVCYVMTLRRSCIGTALKALAPFDERGERLPMARMWDTRSGREARTGRERETCRLRDLGRRRRASASPRVETGRDRAARDALSPIAASGDGARRDSVSRRPLTSRIEGRSARSAAGELFALNSYCSNAG